jgi:hypothetical protein
MWEEKPHNIMNTRSMRLEDLMKMKPMRAEMSLVRTMREEHGILIMTILNLELLKMRTTFSRIMKEGMEMSLLSTRPTMVEKIPITSTKMEIVRKPGTGHMKEGTMVSSKRRVILL